METSAQRLLLSAQRALLGEITRGLRSVSTEIRGCAIYWRCYFESKEAMEREKESLMAASSEMLGDFSDSMTVEEEFLVSLPPERMEHLKYVVFARNEEHAT